MQIEYVGRHFELDDQVRRFTEEKLGKVMKFLMEPIEVHVELESQKFRQIAELHVSHRHGALHTRNENDDIFDAINLAVDTVEKQARRSRKRAVDLRRRASRTAEADRHWPVEVLTRESVRAGEPPRVVKSSRLPIRLMTVEEAATRLEASKNEFFVFLDAESERVSVLYRRKDENYGLIAPEF
ncbi:MAG: ribosome-associated translation inhibitor RaiA [Thermoanaerobaculia bacterium]